MKYFYARVSSREQNLDRQLDKAQELGIPAENIFCDKVSGKDFRREEYGRLKGIIKPGDEVYIKELDRLGRNKDGIKREIEWFREHKVPLRILDVPTTLIDFTGQEWLLDMINNILIEVMGSIAQNEREKIKQRQREGIDSMPIVNGHRVSAKTGRSCGRPKIQTDVLELKAGETVTSACERLNISRATWYRLQNKPAEGDNRC